MSPTKAYVEPIRSASRRLVRELGFMQSTLAGTSMPPSAVHALIEMGAKRSLRAHELAEKLRLDKSTVSRLIQKLVRAGEVREASEESDARAKLLSLTPKGERSLTKIHHYARSQVIEALKRLPREEYATVVRGLALYADALAGVEPAAPRVGGTVRIKTGYEVNVLAKCIEMQTAFYARAHGFGRAFEAGLAAGLAEFSSRMDKPCNQLWRATLAERLVGTVAIDGEDLGKGIAHLRWFIVDDSVRGCGIGTKLLSAALAFCDDRDFSETHLWTFRGLDTARRLYEARGFALVEERPGDRWGKRVIEQRFVRKRP